MFGLTRRFDKHLKKFNKRRSLKSYLSTNFKFDSSKRQKLRARHQTGHQFNEYRSCWSLYFELQLQILIVLKSSFVNETQLKFSFVFSLLFDDGIYLSCRLMRRERKLGYGALCIFPYFLYFQQQTLKQLPPQLISCTEKKLNYDAAENFLFIIFYSTLLLFQYNGPFIHANFN